MFSEIFNEAGHDFTHPWPHLKSFYDPVIEKNIIEAGGNRSLSKGLIKCTRCSTKVRFSTKSTFTLKSHYKNVSFTSLLL